MKVNVLAETKGLSKEEWLKLRKRGIGGSDVSSILGINKWKSELELWLEKTDQDCGLPVENEAMMWGNIMEPVIRKHFYDTTGRKVIEVKAIMQSAKYPFMIANVDGITVDDNGNPAILEIKTTSEYKRYDWEKDVPNYYQVQVQHYLCVTGLDKAYIAVLIGGNTFKVFEVNSDREIQKMLISLEADFWNKVEKRIRPEIDGSDTAKNLLDSMYKGGIEKQKILPDEVLDYINDYINASKEEDNAKANKQKASNRIKEIMGDYDRGLCQGHTVTWKSVSTDRFDSKAFKEADPELYSKYVKPTTSRRFTIR